jgi:hypothetical protein
VIDLDAIKPNGWADPDTVLSMVAELRAAREVVEAAWKAHNAVDLIGTTKYSKGCLSDLGEALDAYDQIIGGGS